MKFSSIFSARRRLNGETRIEDAPGPVDADEAARLFGIPPDQVTPGVRAALQAMGGEICDLRVQLSVLQEALNAAASMADHDPLVPLFNRRAFLRELSRLLSFSRRYGLEASLVYFDLDGFKDVNDRFGHAAGDAVLRQVAEVMMRQTRESDILGRIGGDEFVVALTGVDAEGALLKADQLANAIREGAILVEGESVSVGASFGVVAMRPDSSPDHLIAQADEAMYAQKADRRRRRLSA